MKTIQRIAAGIALTFGLAAATPAVAEPILLDGSSINDSFTISFDGFVDSGPSIDGLSSQLQLTLTSIIDGVYNFDYALTNTGATDDSVSSRVSSFAFNTDPEIEGATSTGTYGFTNLDRNYPNGIGQVDVCFQGTRTGSCAGGGSGGVFDGDTGSGTLALNFGTAPAQLTLDDFFVRYQSIDGISGVTSASGREVLSSTTGGSTTTSTSTSTSSGGSTSGGTDVPAPSMLAIFAMALLALFGIRPRIARIFNKPAMPALA